MTNGLRDRYPEATPRIGVWCLRHLPDLVSIDESGGASPEHRDASSVAESESPMMSAPTNELLALPAWNSPPRSLQDWRDAIAGQGQTVVVTSRNDETWLEVGSIGLRGYVCIEGDRTVAINFELSPADLEAATRTLERAAQALDWELHADEPEEDDLDED